MVAITPASLPANEVLNCEVGIRKISPFTFVIAPAENIESFSILKDASATAIYGARGANGVMIISTKGLIVKSAFVKYLLSHL